MIRIWTAPAAIALLVLWITPAAAIRTGGRGNEPIEMPNWPKGTAAVFNQPGRICFWEHNGRFFSDCRGDAKAFNGVLADFAKLTVKNKKVTVHDGVGYSDWISIAREPETLEEGRIDWTFAVPDRIDVYTANIPWDEVVVPAGIEVDDQRLVAHGFTPADGIVIEGRVTELAGKKPVAARVRLEQVENKQVGKSYQTVYTELATTKADAEGHYVLKNAPGGFVRVVAEAEGFVPRVGGYERFTQQPEWASHDVSLARAATIAGRVTDKAGKPLADVEVWLITHSYDTPERMTEKTDADGRFHSEQVPVGSVEIRLSKTGYCTRGLGPNFTAPKADIKLVMEQAGDIRVTVDFKGKKRPKEYMVELSPEGGDKIGSYGGGGHIDDSDQIAFDDVPVGKYILRGHPNPYSPGEVTAAVAVDVKGGTAEEVTLKAK